MDKRILVECFSYQLIPDYFFIDELIIISKKKGFLVDVMLHRKKSDTTIDHIKNRLLIKGVTKIYFHKDYQLKFLVIIKATLSYISNKLKYNHLLNYKINNINVGESIYDSIQRDYGIFHISKLTKQQNLIVFKSFIDYFAFKKYTSKNAYSLYITSHLVYSKFSPMARLLFRKKVPVLFVSGTGMKLYNEFSREIYYHNMDYTEKNMMTLISKQRIIQADYQLEIRISGNEKNRETYNAYGGTQLDKTSLMSKLKIDITNQNKNIILIALHIFKDGPHHSFSNIYNDYYQWTIDTLEYLRNKNNVIFLVKPHPSTSRYNEDEIIKKLAKDYSTEYIKFLPADVSTNSLIDIVSSVITYCGTIGLEFACFGIPIITLGRAFYSDFSFNYSPKNLEDYYNYLDNIENIPLLPEDKTNIAKLLFLEFKKDLHFLSDPYFTKNKDLDIQSKILVEDKFNKILSRI